MIIRDPVELELPYRPELTRAQVKEMIDWSVGSIRARGTDPRYPGSTFWELRHAPVRIVLWPAGARLWVTYSRTSIDDNAARAVRHLQKTLATHPGTRHQRGGQSPEMACARCGGLTGGFMPRRCEHCRTPFTWRERVLGTRRAT